MIGRLARAFGPGPVFIYEWIIGSRRWQGYALRSLFVLGLLAALVVVALGRGADVAVAAPTALGALAQLGEGLYVAVVGTQLTLVLLAAPAATAGAICLDRSRGSLIHLLATDLTDGEIVLGKLAARMAPILTLIVATLPVMELLTLLGGVDPDAVLKAFAVTLGVAGLGCSLALVFSIWARRAHEAMLATYAAWGLWLLGPVMLDQSRVSPGLANTTANPYILALAPYWRPGSVDWIDFAGFLAATWGISAALAMIAVLTMRRACTREARRKSRRGARRLALVAGPSARILGRLGPSLDANPVLWREWHRNRPPRWARVVATLFVVLAVVFSVMAIGTGPSGEFTPFVNGFQVAVGLLFLSVIAATSLAEERVRGSLDVLMTTPLETREIVIGKWLGTFRLVPPLAILPVAVVIGIGTSEGRQWAAALQMIAFVLAAGAAITSVGLAMATWCPRLGRAVGLTVSLYVLVTVGWLFLVVGLANGFNDRGLMMGSPWFWAGMMTAMVRGGPERHWGAGLCWTLGYALAALLFFAATLRTFNRCLGRVDGRAPR